MSLISSATAVPLSELEEEKVAVVSLYPGIVKTEKMDNLMTKSPKDFEANVRDTGVLLY